MKNLSNNQKINLMSVSEKAEWIRQLSQIPYEISKYLDYETWLVSDEKFPKIAGKNCSYKQGNSEYKGIYVSERIIFNKVNAVIVAGSFPDFHIITMPIENITM